MKQVIHVLAVMGEGGHSKELLRLVDLMGSEEYRYSYILADKDQVTENKIRVSGPIYRIVRPGSVMSHKLAPLLKYPVCMLQAVVALLRARPDVVITSGPGVAVPACVVAKLMGSRVVFVETGSRIYGLSLTGKLMRRVADLYFVQWQELLPCAPGAVFAGRLF
ncbi:MAG: UDP-N-acetylglucosamine transferase subunit ALG14 [Chloroflexota bacterium]|nr:UDP-N-acetylglucosamine transferase subunit ALG14 [Chloroflexota bacterium]